MKKTYFIAALIAVIVIISFLGFVLFKNINENRTVELTFRITWAENTSRGIAINKIVQSYNESQSKVHVTMVGGNEVRDDYISELAADNIDVYMVPYRYIRDSAVSVEFMLLDELYNEQEQYYYEAIKPLAKSEYGISGIPWIGHSMALIYNKEITDAAGINPEEFASLDDLLAACKTIYETTGKKGLGLVGAESHDITWMVSQFIYTFGGQLAEVDENGIQTAVAINSDESARAIEYYITELGQYAQEGWLEDTGTEVMAAFADGEIAFEIQGPWGITDVWKCGCLFDVGAIALSDIGMCSEVGPFMLSVSKDTQNEEAAKDFISYLTDKSTLEMVMEGEYDDKYEAYYPYRVPLRMDMEDSKFFELYPEFLVFIKGFEKPSINTPSSLWNQEYNDLYSYYLHQATAGEISIEEALELIADKVEP